MPLTWTKEKQAELHKRHAHKAVKQCIRWMKDHEDEIVEESGKRMLGIGFEQYGDVSFRLTYEMLEQAKLEEASDLVVYRIIEIARGWI